MTNLTITDLSITEELDCGAMAAVRGGHAAHYMWMPKFGYGDHSQKTSSFEALQLINQGQSVATNVGNNVAVLGGAASPSVPVTATQNADITNHVSF